jgi:hypothetical protein
MSNSLLLLRYELVSTAGGEVLKRHCPNLFMSKTDGIAKQLMSYVWGFVRRSNLGNHANLTKEFGKII